ncbi:MAG: TraV family lipoprotein [Thiothrix sp.]|uniref:TraV family lipoprotein n=1 Tax=Thiothrix sp. TaxID=1032 RepID=UPI002635346D|nr:TraV family lipoprotein [Thiothrix sp.]MDD5394999.1 TraV family lipoprotein [Thiothrix sp.]
MKMMKTATAGLWGLAFATLLLSGCSTSPSYACGSVQGGKCQSVSDSYLTALGKKLKGSGGTPGKAGKAVEATGARVTQYIPEGIAIRSMPQVMRVWVAPWEDNNGVFHDQGYSYFVADAGQWALSANTEKSIYANGYMALEHPTEKGPVGGAADKASTKGKPPVAMTTAQAQGQAQDFMAGD